MVAKYEVPILSKLGIDVSNFELVQVVFAAPPDSNNPPAATPLFNTSNVKLIHMAISIVLHGHAYDIQTWVICVVYDESFQMPQKEENGSYLTWLVMSLLS